MLIQIVDKQGSSFNIVKKVFDTACKNKIMKLMSVLTTDKVMVNKDSMLLRKGRKTNRKMAIKNIVSNNSMSRLTDLNLELTKFCKVVIKSPVTTCLFAPSSEM